MDHVSIALPSSLCLSYLAGLCCAPLSLRVPNTGSGIEPYQGWAVEAKQLKMQRVTWYQAVEIRSVESAGGQRAMQFARGLAMFGQQSHFLGSPDCCD